MSEDRFTPKLGKIRSISGKAGRKYVHRVLRAIALAGAPGLGKRGRFSGSRIGRGVGVGRVLASRDQFAAFRQRRVIIKSRIVKLGPKTLNAALAHLRYVQRDGVTREGMPGELYSADQDKADGKALREAYMELCQALAYKLIYSLNGIKVENLDAFPDRDPDDFRF